MGAYSQDVISTTPTSNITCQCGGSELVVGTGADVPLLSNSPINPNQPFTGTLRICGSFLIDVDWDVSGATVLMENLAGIFILNDITLAVSDGSTLKACDPFTMWNSVEVQTGGTLEMTNSFVFDAFFGVDCKEESFLLLQNTEFDKCEWGLFIDQSDGQAPNVTLNGPLKGNKFKGQRTNFGRTPFAGILVRDNISIGANFFEGALSGIQCGAGVTPDNEDVSINIDGCEFVNLAIDPFFPDFQGTAIASGRTLQLDESNCTFDNLNLGIGMVLTNATIERNTMQNVNNGFIANSGYQGAMVIRNNKSGLGINELGIGVDGFGYNSLEILTSVINLGPNSDAGIVSNVDFSNLSAIIEDCEINLEVNQGIFFDNAFNIEVNGCRVNDQTPANGFVGINIQGGSDFRILNNMISGSTADHSQGIQVLFSEANTLSCNQVDNTQLGIQFAGANNFTSLVQNQFGNHNFGLQLSEATAIGEQPHHFNTWQNPYTNGQGAVHGSNDPLFVKNSEFRVYSPNNTTLKPEPYNPISWFVEQNIGIDMTPCGEDGGNSNLGNPQYGLMTSIANEQLYDVAENPGLKYDSEKLLYGMLAQEPDLKAQSSDLDLFFNNQSGTNLKKFYEVSKGIQDINLNTEVHQSFNALLELISDKHEEISNHEAVYDGLEENMMAEWKTTYHALQSEVNSLVEEASDLRVEIAGFVSAKIQELIIENENIEPVGIHQQYEQILNEIWLLTVAQGNNDFSEDNLTTLELIANDCYNEVGQAVYRAQSMMRMIDSDASFIDGCESIGKSQKFQGWDIDYPQSFSVYPNPANESITVTFENESENRSLILTDLMGKVLFSQKAGTSNIHLIDVGSLNQGIYFLSEKENGVLIDVQKLIIRK